MRRPRALGVVGVLVGVAGVAALLRRRAAERRERVDVYYEDGSMVSLEDGSPDAAPLLAYARDALRATRAGG